MDRPPADRFARMEISTETAQQLSDEITQDLEDVGPASSDPTSLQTTINSLLAHDEFRQQQAKRNAFHDGWQEGEITFLPSYKYDVGEVASFDSSEKRRGPSWCDRILYRSRAAKEEYENRVREEEAARQRDALLKSNGVDKAANDEQEMLFEYDPETDGDVEDYDAKADDDDNGIPETASRQTRAYDGLTLEYYDTAQHIVGSDHKPVVAVFSLVYDTVIPELKAKVQEEVARQFDKAENENRPSLTVVADERLGGSDNQEDEGLDFGPVRYNQVRTRTITIANTGGSTAIFGFANRPAQPDHDARPAPPWLGIFTSSRPTWHHATLADAKKARAELGQWCDDVPEVFSLLPGDVCDFELHLSITDIDDVRKLNSRQMVLDDVLVLRVKFGRDYFRPVRGSWMLTSNGMSINQLAQLPEGGVRRLQSEDSRRQDAILQDKDPESSLSEGTMWSAPREIFRLTESIESLVERAVAEWTMLHSDTTTENTIVAPWEQSPGWPFARQSWSLDTDAIAELSLEANEALDTDQPFDDTISPELPTLHRLEALANCLLTFLSNLSDGVVPAHIWKPIRAYFAKTPRPAKPSIDATERERAAVLEILAASRNHSVTFVLITSMLSRVAAEVNGAARPRRSTTKAPTRLSLSLPSPVAFRAHAAPSSPTIVSHQDVLREYATIFASILVRTREGNDRQAKTHDADHKERRRLLELFLGIDSS